jgi:hypothetical protein
MVDFCCAMNHEIVKFLESVSQKVPNLQGVKYVVYTALFGAYDQLKDPLVVDEEACYICFTDNRELKSAVWEIVVIESNGLDPRKSARAVKMLPNLIFKALNMSLWVDAKCLILQQTRTLVDELNSVNCNFACFPHSVRKSVKSEALACLVRGYDRPSKIMKQWLFYKSQGFKDTSHLVESTVLARKHNEPEVINFQMAWLQEVLRRSIRDQLSFNFVAYQQKFQYHLYSEPLSKYFEVKPHETIGCYSDNADFKVPLQRKMINFLLRK